MDTPVAAYDSRAADCLSRPDDAAVIDLVTPSMPRPRPPSVSPRGEPGTVATGTAALRQPRDPTLSRLAWTTTLLRRPAAVTVAAEVVLNAIFPAAFVIYILRCSANIPILDTWGFIPTIATFIEHGHVSFASLWSPDGSVHPIIWRLVMLEVAQHFHFDVQLIKLLAAPCALVELSVCYWALVRLMRPHRVSASLLVLVPITALRFGLNNWETILEEWNVQNLAAVAASMLALLAISAIFRTSSGHKRGALLSIGIVLCVIASFLGEPGLLAWPACIIVSLFPWETGYAAERCCLVLATLAFFFVCLPGTATASLGYDLHHVGSMVLFAIAALGNGILGQINNTPAPGLATAFGVIELLLSVAAAAAISRRATSAAAKNRYRVPFGLVGFGLMAAMTMSLDRLPFGLDTATSSRYVVSTDTAAIGLYLVFVGFAVSALHGRARAARSQVVRLPLSLLAPITAVIILFGSGFGDAQQYQLGNARLSYFVSLQYYACHAASATPAQLRAFQYPLQGPPPLRVAIADLAQAHLSVFSDNACSTLSSP